MRIYTRITIMCVAATLAACAGTSFEDCEAVGDEDHNGLAGCADPVCGWMAACQAVCGNSQPEAGEACDDGNKTEGDGCDHNCTVTACGNGIATTGEDCDDGNTTDGDGCDHCRFSACSNEAPVEPGKGDSFQLAGQISKLVADPTSCFVYALNAGSPSQVVVISTASKKELVRVTLPQRATDLAISPSGAYLVVSHDAAHAISIIDTEAWGVAATVPTLSDPYVVEVTDNGVAYYVELERFTSMHRLDLRTSTEGPGLESLHRGDAELSRDGNFLYIGETGTSGGNLVKFNISGGNVLEVDRTTYHSGDGFYFPERHVYLSPSSQHVYYAGYQFDSGALKFVRGSTGEQIYAEDAQGTFAIGTSRVFDAEMVRPVASLPHEAATAVLTADDSELWYYSAPTGRVYYLNMQDLVGGVALGVREIDPGPLSSYHFVKLIHDPVRPRLYGLDTDQAAVVVIDTLSLQPMRTILVGSTPTDLDIDPAGTTLFVGHLDVLAFARIKLDALTFDGFVVTPRNTYRVEAVSNGQVVTIDDDQWTTATLVDMRSGAVLSEIYAVHEGALSATADGATIFIGDSSIAGGTVIRYSLATGQFVEIDRSDYDDSYGFPYPLRSITSLPNGSGVYYAGYLLAGNDLTVLRYPLSEPVIAVSPDGRLALSSSNVYDVATGARLGPLPVMALVLAINSDGTKAFLCTDNGIVSVDLAAF